MRLSSEPDRIVDQLGGAHVLCIGDAMLDHFVYGRVDRISPEAPVPVLLIERDTRVLGGAGNTLRNLAALGAKTTFVAVAGDDETGCELRRLLQPVEGVEAHLLVERGRCTTVKTRFVGGTHQMLRADREMIRPISPVIREDLLRIVESALAHADVVVLSDYAKGVLGDGIAAALIAAARRAGKPVIVDPKGGDYGRYRGATIIKPNRLELSAAARMPTGTQEEVRRAALHLKRLYELGTVLVTLGRDGMMLIAPDERVSFEPARAREVFDVSGAGDTVVAVLAASIAKGIDLETAVGIANAAAGVVVGKLGTATIERNELVAALEQLPVEDEKIVPLSSAIGIVGKWRARRLRIGFATGCFDILQPDHAQLLRKTRASCDRLVIGLHDKPQAIGRTDLPLRSQADRAMLLSSLEAVDLIIPFGDGSPSDVLAELEAEIVVNAEERRGPGRLDEHVR
jgi:D-beta-D-heptose 7-phosphate kinase / D-beta-D-heptose 1-phosphate adenosyltransferase